MSEIVYLLYLLTCWILKSNFRFLSKFASITFFIYHDKTFRRQFSFLISLQLVSPKNKLLQCFMQISTLIFQFAQLVQETMTFENFVFRKKWVGIEMASMKITFFDIFVPNWTQMLGPPKRPKYGIKQHFNFQSIRNTDFTNYYYQLFDFRTT